MEIGKVTLSLDVIIEAMAEKKDHIAMQNLTMTLLECMDDYTRTQTFALLRETYSGYFESEEDDEEEEEITDTDKEVRI